MNSTLKNSGRMFSTVSLQRLIIPLILEQLLSVSVGMIDTLMVSTVGEEAVSGVALVDNINRLVIQILSAFATDGIVVCSQYYGAGKIDKAEEACSQLQTIMVESMLAALLLLSIGARPILRLLFGSVQDSVMEYAVTYLVVTAFSYPFLAIYNAGAAIFRSIGNSKISMDSSLIMNLCNILGNACFVFLFHWEVFGIALSTALSRAIGCGMMQYCVSRPDYELQQRPFPFEKVKWKILKKILYIGIPSGIESGMFQIGKLAVVSMIATLGTEAIAANVVGYQIIDINRLSAKGTDVA